MALNTRSLALTFCIATLGAQVVVAQQDVRYREFVMGSNLASVAKLSGTAASAAKIIHARPNVMQHLEWRPRYSTAGAPLTDPVDVMVFKFYDDQLFTIVADYDPRRTEGMSPADMIAAISETYGPVSQVPSRPLGTQTVQYGFPDTTARRLGQRRLLRDIAPRRIPAVIQACGCADAARNPRPCGEHCGRTSGFRRSAQREVARQKKEAADAAAAQEKAKTENKAQFRP